MDPPVFDNTKVTVIYVLGGPGAGMQVTFWKKATTVYTHSLPRQGHAMRTIG